MCRGHLCRLILPQVCIPTLNQRKPMMIFARKSRGPQTSAHGIDARAQVPHLQHAKPIFLGNVLRKSSKREQKCFASQMNPAELFRHAMTEFHARTTKTQIFFQANAGMTWCNHTNKLVPLDAIENKEIYCLSKNYHSPTMPHICYPTFKIHQYTHAFALLHVLEHLGMNLFHRGLGRCRQ